MFGSKLHNAVVALTPDSGIDLPPLGDDRVETATYPSVDPWLALSTAGPSNGKSPSKTTSAPPSVDCLTLIGVAGDIHRQQLVKQIVDGQAGLPIVVVAKNPQMGEAVGIMRQGAFAVVGVDEPANTLSATIAAAASEGRLTAPKRNHVLDLRERMAELTAPERQVLDAMLDGMANKQIAQALEIGLRTVELRRSKIMRKMNARSLAELVKFVCLVSPSLASEPPKNLDEKLSPAV